MRMILETTLEELIRAYQEDRALGLEYLKAKYYRKTKRRELKKLEAKCNAAWEKVCAIKYEMNQQSGLSDTYFLNDILDVLSSDSFEYQKEILTEILKVLKTEVVSGKWWFEGVIRKTPEGQAYIKNEGAGYSLCEGDKISVRFDDKHWITDYVHYLDNGEIGLLNWGKKKIEGLIARVSLINEVAE